MRSATLLVCLILTLNVSYARAFTAGQTSAAPAQQSDEEKDWAAVVALGDEAFKILARESRAADAAARRRLWQQRTEAFELAQRRTGDWIRKYVGDNQDSLKFLQALLRLGIYAEHAANYFAASRYYSQIGEHPLLRDAAAVFNGRTISRVGFKHLQKVQAAVQAIRSLAPGATDDASVRPLLTQNEQALEKFLYLKTSADVAEARSIFVADTPEQVICNVSGRLKAAGLRFNLAAGDGVVVFGIDGEAKDAAALARRIAATRQQLVSAYMPSAPQAPVLTMYANLGAAGPAEFVRKVSAAVLSEEVTGRETFYDPLQYAVILGKPISVSDTPGAVDAALRYSTLALLNADCPGVPRYVAEGISLAYEEVGPNGPTDNYRLYYLLEAQKAGKLPKLAEVPNAKDADWSGPRGELLEAVARYLALFLAQRDPKSNQMKSLYEKTCGRIEAHNLPPPDQLEAGFAQFVNSRDVKEVDRHWAARREGITRYIEGLPKP